MWSFAQVELGLTEKRFYRLTFRQWDALRKQAEAKHKRNGEMIEYMTASLIAMVANTGFRGFKEPRQPSEFMPSHHEIREGASTPLRTRRQRAMSIQRTMDQAMAYQKAQVERGLTRE